MTRLDDVEAAVFVLVEADMGTALPWATAKSDDEACEAKKEWVDQGSVGAEGFGPVLEFLEQAAKVEGGSKIPDYAKVKALLGKIARSGKGKRKNPAKATKNKSPAKATKNMSPAEATKKKSPVKQKSPVKVAKRSPKREIIEIMDSEEEEEEDGDDDEEEEGSEGDNMSVEENCLVLRFESGPDSGSAFKIGSQAVVFGRNAAYKLKCSEVSSKHCKVVVSGGRSLGLTVQDLGSSNGVFVNGNRIVSKKGVKAFINDRVRIGGSVAVVSKR